MTDSGSIEFDWLVSLLVQKIAADIMIQEAAIKSINDMKIFEKGLRRCQLHVRLLQIVLQVKQNLEAQASSSSDLMKSLKSMQTSLSDLVCIVLDRSKPLVNVLYDEKLLVYLLRVVALLLLLENPSLKRIYIGIRKRPSYVSVKFLGAKVNNRHLLDRELISLVQTLVNRYDGDFAWRNVSGKRVAFLRLHLSNQMDLIK